MLTNWWMDWLIDWLIDWNWTAKQPHNLPVELRHRNICLSEFRQLLKMFLFCWDSATCDFCLSAPCTSTLTYLLTYLLTCWWLKQTHWLTSCWSCSSVVCGSVISNGKVSWVESLIRATIFLRVSADTGQNGAQEWDRISNHGDCGISSRHSTANCCKDQPHM